MTEESITMDTLEGEYMDSLVKVALEYDDFLEAEEVMAKCHLAVPAKDRVMARQAYLRAMSSCAEDHRQSKKRRRISSCKSFATKVTKVAAYIMVLMTVAAPVAMANVPEIRASVMSLLISTNLEEQVVNINTLTNKNTTLDVPADWGGEYFLSFLPDGFSLSSCISFLNINEVKYSDSFGNNTMTFTECCSEYEAVAGIDNGDVSYTFIDGHQIFSVTSLSYAKCIWSIDGRWFVLESPSLTNEQLLSIAENVKRIIYI